jgi:hypothetical protein
MKFIHPQQVEQTMKSVHGRTISIILLVGILLVLFGAQVGVPAAPALVQPTVLGVKYAIADNHIHYLDFLQKTDGFEKLVAAGITDRRWTVKEVISYPIYW